jgi:hypothetical protein
VLYAYYVSALFLVLVPFGIVGSILAWLFIQNRKVDGGEVLQDGTPSEAEACFSQEVPA